MMNTYMVDLSPTSLNQASASYFLHSKTDGKQCHDENILALYGNYTPTFPCSVK